MAVKKPKKKIKTLIIVESPTKIKSLSKFLEKSYKVESSKGHLIDLPRSKMGIKINENFEPEYITIRGKGKTLAELKKAAKNSDSILLATDPDREGEAISWHLARALSVFNGDIKRIEFNEITKSAVLEAISHPREIDLKKVNSQQARRLLDRLVGYSISPILQQKFHSKRFSAGRVQSVALRIIANREEEIESFQQTEYWEAELSWKSAGSLAKDSEVFFKLVQINGEKAVINNKSEIESIENECSSLEFVLKTRKKTERNIKPSAPFITSRLQQEASTRLGFRAQKTMSVAQSLYEGVDLGKSGSVGLITYMRTDSTRISDQGLTMIREFIKTNYEPEYLSPTPNIYHAGKAAQDAHEAIRPTDVNITPQSIASFVTKDQLKLYELIWSRAVASQMTPGVDELVTLEAASAGDKYLFRFSSGKQVFAGFRAVFPVGENKKSYIPSFQEGDLLKLDKFQKEQKFTQPPPRYTEASLIKIMEESGIGRPATYVPTIMTLDKRKYIERKGRQLKPTTLGILVNDIMQKHFSKIVNLEFTANMEKDLDEIANGDVDWRKMLHVFYKPFEADLLLAAEKIEDMGHIIRIPIGRDCPQCENPLMEKLGRNGYFIGCSNFIGGCRYTESIPLGKCPLCSGNVVSKSSKKGRKFFGCDNFSVNGCTFTMLDKPAGQSCPKCNSIMGQKVKKSGITLTCQNPDCKCIIEQKNE